MKKFDHNSIKSFSCLRDILPQKVLLHFLLVSFFILPLVACPLWGQAGQKKDLTVADYHLWGSLNLEKISPNQQWVSYTMAYENNIDTLFVRNATTLKTFNYTSVQSSIFTNNNVFVCQNDQGLHILHLNSAKQQLLKSVVEYAYSASVDLLIVAIQISAGNKKLIVQTPDGTIKKEIVGVTSFSLSPDQHQLVFETAVNNKFTVSLMDLKKIGQEKQLLTNNSYNSFGFTWNKEGKALAFGTKSKEPIKTKLFYYIVEKDKLYGLDTGLLSNLPENTFIPADFTFKLSLSDDMQKVFFTTKINDTVSKVKPLSKVEIWNANDKSLYVEKQKKGCLATAPRVVVWYPLSNFTAQITTNELPKLILSGDQKFAFLWNNNQYEPQFKIKPGPADIYLMNLETFEKKLFIKKHSAHSYEIIPSPNGRYISYFKDNDWWVYDRVADRHNNITTRIKTQFTSADLYYSITSINCNAGWTIDDKEVLIYDDYDLWAIKPDGSAFRRLTHGRESKIRYRLAIIPGRQKYVGLYDGLKVDNFDTDSELLLHAQGDDGKTGYFKWSKQTGEKALVYGDRFIDQILYTPKKENFVYREQKFDLPPQLMMKRKQSNPYTFFRSNPQHKKYHWGTSELIEYENANGTKMKGVLRYPTHYDPQKKYPMIVHIYQKQYYQHHLYVNPTIYREDTDNDAVWTAQDYFVLRPDIIKENDMPGISALDCVTAAVKKVIGKGIVNRDKIGLMGHSYGGYETTFIITQSSLFAAAIAGAASTDLNSFYYTLAKDFSYPNMFRFTEGQWIIKQTPFENPDVFRLNSPIVHANKVTTPLLLWSGKEDYNIDPNQSMEFYFALRLLGKKCIMLLYPDEAHGIATPVNQKDMTDRALQWFAYYLKDDVSAEWITEGVK